MSIGNGVPYVPVGFRLDGSIEEGDVVWGIQAVNTTIVAGQALKYSSGFLTPYTGTIDATFAGIAMFGQVTTTPAGSVQNMAVIKPNRNKYFWAPVGSGTLVTQAAVGTLCDLSGSLGEAISLTANSPTAYGFQISDFDASTLAVNANASGFVKGCFVPASE